MSQEIESTITQLEAWRDRIAATIETLRYFLAQGSGLPSSPPPGSSGRSATEAELRHDSFFQMTIPDAAAKYLALVKQTKSTSEVADGLLKGGLKTSSKAFGETVRAIVSRDDRFVRVNGEWGLSAWYPAMKRERKSRPVTDAPSPSKTEKNTQSQPAPADTPKRETQGDTIPDRILKFLEKHPTESFAPTAIAGQIGAKTTSVKAALALMFKNGTAAKPKEGHYQWIKREAA